MQNFYCISIQTPAGDQRDELLAAISVLSPEGFEENETDLTAWFNEAGFPEEALERLLQAHHINFQKQFIKGKNWNSEWEANFQPVIIDNTISIRANFHQPIVGMMHEIIITPKMSFGTGHHATTYLMISQMSHLIFDDKSVLDFGTGTGVLSILAEKMGAKNIDAIDNDDWSIENTRENISANNCSRIKINKADTIAGSNKYDIILANINLNVINQNLPAITAVCKKGTLILLSGFLTKNIDELSANIHSNHMSIIQKDHKEGWICLLSKKD